MKNSKIPALIALFVFITIFITIIAACEKTPGEDGGDGDISIEYRDFDGQVFKHVMPATSDWHLFWPEEAKTLEGDRIRAKSKAVEEALNVVLVDEKFGDESASAYQALLAVGDYSISWASQYGTPNAIYGMWKAGYLQSWNNISSIDLSNAELWGSAQKQLPLTYDGELWGYPGKGHEGGESGRLMYNNEYIKMFSVTPPQELHEQKKWTWDAFEEMINTCNLSEDNKKVYGLSLYNDPQMLPLSAIFSNGGQIVKYKSDGTPVFSLLDNDALDALEWVKRISANKMAVFQDNWPPTTFSHGGATFMLTRAWVGTSSNGESELYALDNLKDFGWIPFPYGPAAEYGKTSGSYDSEKGGIVMLYGQEKEDMGYVFSVFQQMKLDDGGPDEHELWKRKTFFTEESYQNYMAASNNFNYDYFSQLENSYTKMVEAFKQITSGKKSAVEALQGIQEAMETAISENVGVRIIE